MPQDLSKQLRGLPLKITAEACAGGTYIVTGANTGLGLEAAKHLVAIGAAKVILGVRDLTAGEEARAEIAKETGKNTAEVWEVDLSKYGSVKAFADRATAELDRIDAVIENAGVAALASQAEGHLIQFTVNVYSTFLMAALLFPKLRESAKMFGILPHLTIVTSNSVFDIQKIWDTVKEDPLVKSDTPSIGMGAYPLSKLFEIYAVQELADILPVSQTGVVINAVNPGLCKTSLARNAPPAFKEQLAQMHASFGRTAEDGSRTLLHGAVGGKESHGSYLDDCEVGDHKLPSWITEDSKKYQGKIWNGIAKELETFSPDSVKRLLAN